MYDPTRHEACFCRSTISEILTKKFQQYLLQRHQRHWPVHTLAYEPVSDPLLNCGHLVLFSYLFSFPLLQSFSIIIITYSSKYVEALQASCTINLFHNGSIPNFLVNMLQGMLQPSYLGVGMIQLDIFSRKFATSTCFAPMSL